MHTLRPIWLMLLWSILALPATAQTLSGIVYRDFDGDGAYDTYEDGVPDIDVAVYDAGANLVGSGITADDGTYNLALSVGAGTAVRVTFTNIPGYLFTAPLGTDNRGTVVFAQSGDSDVDLGLQNPGEHCQASPTLATTCFIYGEQSTSTSDTLVSYSYTAGNNGSSNTPSDYDTPAHLQEAAADEIGSTFGLAYQGASNSLFVAAYMKRHSGFGPDGVGAIYRVDRGTANVSLFVDLDALFPGSTGTDPHPFGTDFDKDAAAWDNVGKIALGGMDLSEDQQTLYVMNLADRQLYALPIGLTPTAPSAGDVSRFTVPTPSGCAVGDVRPFAVRVHDGMVYVGVVCSAESTGLLTDLDAVIYRFDPSDSSWTQVMRFDLNYSRGCANSATSATCNTSGSADYQPAGWRAWRSSLDATVLTQTKGFFNTIVYAQPMLTDIDFARGYMLIGLRDRLGDQTGTQTLHPTSGAATRYIGISAGDLLIAKDDGMGGFTLESNGSVNAVVGGGVANSQGPGGGEFFAGEFYRLTSVDHSETSIGGIGYAPGTNEILNNVFDPVVNTSLPNNTTYDAGTHWYSLGNGAMNRAYRVFNGPPPVGAPTGPAGTLFGKANGLGDLEPLCEAPTTQIGNRVWNDLNGNGLQDAGEPGLAGVTVSLDCGMGTSTTMTDSDGVYVFTVANGATCDITIDLTDVALGGRILTTLDAGSSDTLDSDAAEAAGMAQITVTAGGLGQNDHSYDFGFVAGAQIGDFIWNDVNGDGLQTGEAGNGFNNVTVDLVRDLNGNGTVDMGESVIDTTTTDVNGAYGFTDLLPGDYIVLVTDTNAVLTGYAATTTEPLAVALSVGDTYATADFGYQILPPGSIGDFVWNDLDGDGVQDLGEPGIANVTLDLIPDLNASGVIDGGETSVDTETTDMNGFYEFGELPSGAYLILVTDTNTVLTGLLQTGGTQPHAYALSLSENYTGADFGYDDPATASIGDFVWSDGDGDGVQDGGETGIAGVTLDLIDDANSNGDIDGGEAVLATETTDGSGLYHFTGLDAGNYIVTVTDTGNVLTGLNLTGGTQPHAVSLAVGQAYTEADFGYDDPGDASIGDFVWSDDDGDGVQDGGEPGFAGVTLDLIADLNGNGAIDGGEPVLDTQTTDGSGLYHFTGLDAGTYLVQVTDTNNVVTGLTLTGGTNPQPVTLAVSQNYATADFGYDDPATASIGDFVWSDGDGDGVQDGGETGIAGVTLDLIDDANSNGDIDGGEAVLATETTDGSGLYHFTGLDAGNYIVTVTDTGNVLTGLNLTGGTQPHAVSLAVGQAYTEADFGYDDPGDASIGDFVWSDDDGDGVQDGGEPGFAGVTLDLIADLNGNGAIDGGEPVLDTQTTDGSGLYHFTGLDAGTYLVQVTDTNSVVTGQNLSGGTNPHPVTLAISQAYVTADFGYTHLADSTIGDTVYLDDNSNGSQDGGEPGIDGVTLDLIRDLNGNGTLDGGEPVLLSTTTAGGGHYLFESLSPGDYLVQVTDTGAVLTGYTLTGGSNPHVVTDLPEDTEYLDADFGYYRDRPVIGAAKRASLNGNHVTYNLVVENLGNVTLTNPSLTDNLDTVFGAGLWTLATAPSFVVDPGSFTLRGDFNGTSQTQLITAGGSLAAGASAEITFEVIVYTLSDQGHGNGVYYNQVTVVATPPGGGTVTDISDDGSDPDPNDDGDPSGKDEDDPTIVILTKMPLLTATKSDRIFDDLNKNGELDPGEQVEYTVIISNIGDGPAENVIFASGVDPNTDFEVGSVTTTQGTVTTGNSRGGPVVVVELGDIAGGESATITFRATVHDPLPGGVTQIECQGTVTSDNTPPGLETDDPDTGKPGDPTITPLGGAPLIEATKADSLLIDLDDDGNVDPGETLRYTVVITNTGTRAATEVVFASGVDPKTTLVVGSVTTSAGTVSLGNTAGDTSVQVQIGDIAISGTVTVTFDVQLIEPWPPLETEVVCQGTVSGGNISDEPTDDPDTKDDDDPTVTPVEITPVVTIIKTSELWVDENGDGVLNPGDTLRYTIVVHNEGPVTALAAVVTDAPDPNTTLLVGTVDTTVGTVTEGNGAGDTTVEVVLGDMAVDASETIHFQVLVTPAPGVNQIYNQAFVQGDNFNQVGSDNPNSTVPDDPTEDVIVYSVPTLGETALLLMILSMAIAAVLVRRKAN